ncbi:hypothetical protein ACFO4E_24635 [Nocardiopsis mangrovi]|uniref:PD-(D/E)XK nuclease family transposase n=1 Tax=Nocardiopsis mangrovi TaxID=1179818 RepID=A0ABV9E1P3_9ACTN
MPSYEHEVLIDLFRQEPELAPEVLSGILGVDVPDHTKTDVENVDLTDVRPTEYRADMAISVSNKDREMAIIIEVQRARNNACGDVDQLNEWMRRAITAEAVDDLFA